jgi:NAD(P) transhydrogenase
MQSKLYDLVVLGCGPAGEKAALAGKKLGKSVALIEPQFVGGLCAHTGTVPTKSFREAVVQLTNFRERFMEFGVLDRPKMADLKLRVEWVRGKKVEAIGKRLFRRGVDILPGWGRFHTTNEIGVYNDDDKLLQVVEARNVIITTGTVPYLRPDVDFDQKRIFYTDNVLAIPEVPQTLTVVGGGIIGTELASIFTVIGTQVTLIDRRETFMPFLNKSIHSKLLDHFAERRMKFIFEDEVKSAAVNAEGLVETRLVSGDSVSSEMALFCEFRTVATEKLNLTEVGVNVNQRGVIEVDNEYRTSVECIFAAGDVVGSPALASTSFEQGRIAGNIACGNQVGWSPANFPVGIYTIPEVSYIGATEQELKQNDISYVKGTSLYRESARGAILGTLDGMAEMLVAPESGKVLGVHIIGDQASELVHVAQAVMLLGGTYEYFIESVFNYPTLAEMLKYAAISARDLM